MVYCNGAKMITWKKVLQWLLILFIVYLAFEIIRKILGGSLGFEELIIGLTLANSGYIISLHSKMSDVNAKLSEHLGWHKAKNNQE